MSASRTNRKAKPYTSKMRSLSIWIGQEMRSHRNRHINPFALQMAYDSWKVIRMALNRASK